VGVTAGLREVPGRKHVARDNDDDNDDDNNNNNNNTVTRSLRVRCHTQFWGVLLAT
jgi:hypothetical protein